MLERAQSALFSQLVVVPLFKEHRILIQVAGHSLNVVKALPAFVLTEDDVDEFTRALDQVIAGAQRLPRAAAKFALQAARASR
jgi:ornithine--oxo-acid transaminase